MNRKIITFSSAILLSLLSLVPMASALEVSVWSGVTTEITQDNISKLTPAQIEQAKMQLPSNFRIRGIIRDSLNKPMSNIRVAVTDPTDKLYVTYTDESGLFGLSLIDIKPSELKFKINETVIQLRKTPSNLSTYAFIIQNKGKGLVIPDSQEVFWSEDIKYLALKPVIKANPYFLGVQNATDAFYVGFSIFVLIISIAMYFLVSATVSEESMNF